MIGKTPNKVYDPFLKAGLSYQNPERLKKAIAAQPKMYHGEMLQSTNSKIDSPDYEETLEDAKESRLKMRNKMIQLDYGNLYETFVPQKEPFVEQTYFSVHFTSNVCSESNEVMPDLQIPKMPKEKQKNELLQSEIEKISSGCQDGIPERSIERRSFVSQPNGLLDPDFPNHAYHLKKALYGLK
ncbi:hypothetical protein Tco_1013739 [Tanacetum coccineum]